MVILYCRSDSYGSYNCRNKKISLKNAKPSPVTVLKEEIKMTRNEARSAFHTAVPVMCGGIEYVCISAIIYRYRRFLRAPADKNEPDMYAELLSSCGHSVSVAPVEKISFKEEK